MRDDEIDRMTRSSRPSLVPTRSEWLPLRTFILLRWMAIGGQFAAIVAAEAVFGFQLPMGLCLLAISAAMCANLILGAIYPATKRLTEVESLGALLFDVVQLAALLFLTGGLTNPFALLLLAPVIVAASALNLRETLILGGVSALLATGLFWVSLPLTQVGGAILTTPLLFRFGFLVAILLGIAFLGLYARKVATDLNAMSDALLATQMALAREQKLTDLGGVVAAAAHELGTPLSTIKLISTELARELQSQPALHDDALLIRTEADRCRAILRDMGQTGKDDLLVRAAPFGAILREAAQPHLARGKTVHFHFAARDGDQIDPEILRRPELIHGLRNLIQNAVDFATAQVWIDGSWTKDSLGVTIFDDGAGYPPHMIDRIGEPFLRARQTGENKRPEYDGMGLGLFIAKTLLERTGASITFANATDPFLSKTEAPERCGAVVECQWRRADLAANTRTPLGSNQANTAV